MYIKWVFNSFLPSTALPRWKLVQQRLVSVFFKQLCADPKASDAARVLRVVGSINSKNNEAVRIIYQGDVCSFDALALAVLEQNRMSQIDRDAVKTLTQKYQNDQSKQVKPRARKWNGEGKTWANLLGQELPKIIEILGAGDGMRGRMESLAFVVMNYRLMADLVASESNYYEQVEELGQRMGADVEVLKSLVKNLWDRRQRGETSYRLTKEKIRERLCLDPAKEVDVFQKLPWLLDRPDVVKPVKKLTSKILVDPARVRLLIDAGMQLKQVSNLLSISSKTAKKLLIRATLLPRK